MDHSQAQGFDFTKVLHDVLPITVNQSSLIQWSACMEDLTTKLSQKNSTEVISQLTTADPQPQRNYDLLNLHRCQILSVRRSETKRKSTDSLDPSAIKRYLTVSDET